jgi:pseudaminic acid biosynthesis-associated methylase
MAVATKQTRQWMSEFGRDYTDRNARSEDELETLYTKKYGVSRRRLNEIFLSGIDHSITVLEVGCNVGDQLRLLQKIGFTSLHGIELQDYAARLLRSRTRNIDVIQSTVFNIPFRAGSFDLVFTSDVLIHISPFDISRAIAEIHRCAKEYIWGFEYYAEKYVEVTYRGNQDLLWKTDFAKLYLEAFEDLQLVREERYRNLDNPDNLDSMFLLKKH